MADETWETLRAVLGWRDLLIAALGLALAAALALTAVVAAAVLAGAVEEASAPAAVSSTPSR